MSEQAATILIVDDEHSLVDLVSSHLVRDAYRVHCAYDGRDTLELARQEEPDLVVFDLMLPEIDPFAVCRQLRQFSLACVLMLTAPTEESNRVVGLSVGADDCVNTSFHPRELVARVNALLRRPGTITWSIPEPSKQIVECDGQRIDLAGHEVERSGEAVPLTPAEFNLLGIVALRSDRLRRLAEFPRFARQRLATSVFSPLTFHTAVTHNSWASFWRTCQWDNHVFDFPGGNHEVVMRRYRESAFGAARLESAPDGSTTS